MKINYHNRRFRPVKNTDNGETSSDTLFLYRQVDNILTAEYSGGDIVTGHLIALVGDKGELDMRYHQVNKSGELMTGICHSSPEILPDGRIRLYEKWKWTSGDMTDGESVLEEIL